MEYNKKLIGWDEIIEGGDSQQIQTVQNIIESKIKQINEMTPILERTTRITNAINTVALLAIIVWAVICFSPLVALAPYYVIPLLIATLLVTGWSNLHFVERVEARLTTRTSKLLAKGIKCKIRRAIDYLPFGEQLGSMTEKGILRDMYLGVDKVKQQLPCLFDKVAFSARIR